MTLHEHQQRIDKIVSGRQTNSTASNTTVIHKALPYFMMWHLLMQIVVFKQELVSKLPVLLLKLHLTPSNSVGQANKSTGRMPWH